MFIFYFISVFILYFRPGVHLPLDLSEITPDRQYESFILTGELDHSRETFVGPRTRLDNQSSG